MKRAKKLVALATVAVITLGSAVTALAATSPGTSTTGAPSTSAPAQDTAAPAAAVAATASTEAAAETTYADTRYTDASYSNEEGRILGTYPVITGMDDLNKTIFNTIWEQYTTFSVNDSSANASDYFSVTYTVVEDGRFTVITVNLNFPKKSDVMAPVVDSHVYIIDKTDKSLATDAAYKQAKADEAAVNAVAEEAATTVTAVETTTEAAVVADQPVVADAAEEIAMIGLRVHAASLGYSLEWVAEENAVIVSFGENVFTTVYVDVNAYVVDGVETELESAPVNEDGTVFVPVSFFEKVLGATVSIDEDGNFMFEMPAQ